MQFLFVDKINEITGNDIKGTLCIESGPYVNDGKVSPGFISEAIGQLASWLCIEKSNFTQKPVFLFCPEIKYGRSAPAGATIEIHSTIDRMEDDSLMFSGEATVDGEMVARIRQCNCHLMPLDKLEDPEMIRERFEKIRQGTWVRNVGNGDEEIRYEAIKVPDENRWQVDLKNIEFVYADHFPRYPVTPIVVLNEVVHRVLSSELNIKSLNLIKGLKIRNFILPNEKFELSVTKFDERKGHPKSVQIDLKKNEKHVMRGLYEIEQ